MKALFNLLILLVFIFACDNPPKLQEEVSAYPIKPVDIKHVKVTDEFWLPIIKRVQQKTVDYALQKCKEEGRFENF